MERTGRQRPVRPRAVRRWSGAVGSGVLACLAGGRLALLIVAAGIFVLLAVIAAVIAGAAFAPAPRDRAAARTLDMLLRLAPRYRPRPPDARDPPPDRRAGTVRPSRAATAPCAPEPGGPGVDCRPQGI
jgi:hypothetical protein